MNLKRAISALAALAVSVSCMAGLVISANAAEAVGEVLYGVNTDGVVTAQTDFTGDDNAATLDADMVFKDVTFLSGSILSTTSAAIEKNFAAPITTGKVKFAASYTSWGGASNVITLVDSAGSNIVSLYPVDSKNSGTVVVLKVGNDEISNYIYTPRAVAYWLKDLTLDLDAKTYSYEMQLCTGGGSGTVNKVETKSGTGTLNGVTSVKGMKTLSSSYQKIDNLALYSIVDDTPKYAYTVNYKLGDEIVKTDSGNVVAGTEVSTVNTFDVGEGENMKRYFITAAEAPKLTVTAEGTNTLDVPVREANKRTITVNATGPVAVCNKQLSTGTMLEGDSYRYTFPEYIMDTETNTIYETAKQNDGYFATIAANAFPAEDQTINIAYTKAHEDVAYFVDLEGSTSNSADNRASNGSAYDNKEFTSTETIPAGTYTIYINMMNKGRGSSMKVGDQTIFTVNDTDFTKNAWQIYELKHINITAAGALSLVKGASATDLYDTIVFVKETPNVIDETATTAVSGNLTEAQIAALTQVGTSDVAHGLTAASNTTIYTVKVNNYDGTSLPQLVIDDNTTLTPSGEVTYGYQDGDAYVFVIQTVGYDRAKSVKVGDSTLTFAAN